MASGIKDKKRKGLFKIMTPKELTDICSKIKAIVTDVDGCLTTGKIIYGTQELEVKEFDSKDGMGVTLANNAGFITAIITGRTSAPVERRGRELKFSDCFQGFEGKIKAWEEFKKRHSLEDEEICYLGDDLLDLPVMVKAGLTCAPSDAVIDVQNKVHVVLTKKGGNGAFREMVELVLKSQNRWDEIVESYLSYS